MTRTQRVSYALGAARGEQQQLEPSARCRPAGLRTLPQRANPAGNYDDVLLLSFLSETQKPNPSLSVKAGYGSNKSHLPMAPRQIDSVRRVEKKRNHPAP